MQTQNFWTNLRFHATVSWLGMGSFPSGKGVIFKTTNMQSIQPVDLEIANEIGQHTQFLCCKEPFFSTTDPT